MTVALVDGTGAATLAAIVRVGSASAAVNGAPAVVAGVPAGPCEIAFSAVRQLAPGLPPSSSPERAKGIVPSLTRAELETKRFPVMASDGATYTFELRRAPAAVIDVDAFSDAGAVLLPSGMEAIAAALRHAAAHPELRLCVTGHGRDVDAGRATSTLAMLRGERATWVDAALKAQRDEDAPLLRDAIGSSSGPLDRAALEAVYERCQDAIAARLTLSREALAERQRALRFTGGGPAPAPPPDPTRPTTDDPPRGGRPVHFPFLRIHAKNSFAPFQLAQWVTGDAADYIKSLNPLNPHLCKNGNWKANLAPNDEINLPLHYAEHLSRPDNRGRQRFDIYWERPTPPSPSSSSGALFACAEHHLDAPVSGAKHRRGPRRRAEIVFVETERAPRVCEGSADAPCTADTCVLYDPREVELEYLPVEAPPPSPTLRTISVTLHDADGQPLAGEPVHVWLPDGTLHVATLDDAGHFALAGVPPGPWKLTFPDLPEALVKPTETI
jgi:hypothetical protein